MDTKFQAHYTALKILRLRCEYLQNRLDSLEEENCQLKLQKVQVQEKAVNNASYNNCLEEQIILLNKQNVRMSKQIEMIAAENQNLWSNLSKLMSDDEVLGNALSVSVVPSRKERQKYSDANIINESLSNLMDDCSKETLEEISLKLINGILIGKTELENQYSQMVDLQKENNSIENSEKHDISKLPSQFDCRATINGIKAFVQKMKNFRQALLQQKIDLSDAITNVKSLQHNFAQNNTVKSDNLNEETSSENTVHSPSEVPSEIRNKSENSPDSVNTCPMCAMSIVGNFGLFYQHVASHFEDEDIVP